MTPEPEHKVELLTKNVNSVSPPLRTNPGERRRSRNRRLVTQHLGDLNTDSPKDPCNPHAQSHALTDAALAYAKRGWSIFPCNSNKEPLTPNGVLDATTNPETIRSWYESWPQANIGLNAGEAGFMVIDLDPGHDPEYPKSLPETLLRSTTPRGGRHLFFALAPGEKVSPSASRLAPHVDVRSFHSYVLLPPSRTEAGAYEWESEGQPAYRTDEMVRLANVAREKHKDRDEWLIEPDLPENVAAAIRWLKEKAKPAKEGMGGEAMAYATAAHLKSFGISQALAFDLMWEHWNPRCVPPWDADEIEHFETKIENAYRYNLSPPGNITAAYRIARQSQLFKPVQKPLASGHECTAGRFRFVDREGMAHIPPPSWLIRDFLPQGAYALMFGAPGTFKTFLALDAALNVCTGGFSPDSLWHGQVEKAGNVLFAVGEGRGQLTSRISAWEARHYGGARVDGFVLADPVPNVAEDIDPFIAGALAASPQGFSLVVIDTIGRSMQGLNENSQEHVSKFCKRRSNYPSLKRPDYPVAPE